ncbi:uncharacterized protein LOC135361367 [Latimeria chalumnae]|uniref:uncharacterized protein LOC135361367 n=1 Tax=Latimeria chalumnae TaxID=7897 RepID=UPI00313C6A40
MKRKIGSALLLAALLTAVEAEGCVESFHTVHAVQGETRVLRPNVEGKFKWEDANVEWRYKDRPVCVDGQIHDMYKETMLCNKSDASLSLKSLQPNNSGVYRLTVPSDQPKFCIDFKVVVEEIISKPEIKRQRNKDSLVLSCSAPIQTNAVYNWTVPSGDGYRYRVDQQNLTIYNFSQEPCEEFTCEARNHVSSGSMNVCVCSRDSPRCSSEEPLRRPGAIIPTVVIIGLFCALSLLLLLIRKCLKQRRKDSLANTLQNKDEENSFEIV